MKAETSYYDADKKTMRSTIELICFSLCSRYTRSLMLQVTQWDDFICPASVYRKQPIWSLYKVLQLACELPQWEHWYHGTINGILFKNRNDQKVWDVTANSLNCEIHSCYHLLNDASLYRRSAASDALDGSMLYL